MTALIWLDPSVHTQLSTERHVVQVSCHHAVWAVLPSHCLGQSRDSNQHKGTLSYNRHKLGINVHDRTLQAQGHTSQQLLKDIACYAMPRTAATVNTTQRTHHEQLLPSYKPCPLFEVGVRIATSIMNRQPSQYRATSCIAATVDKAPQGTQSTAAGL